MNLAHIISKYGVYKLKEEEQLPYIGVIDLNFKSPGVGLYSGQTFSLGIDGVMDDINHLLQLEDQGNWDEELASSIMNTLASNIKSSSHSGNVSVVGLSNKCYNDVDLSFLTAAHIDFLVDGLQDLFDILLIDAGGTYITHPEYFRGIDDRNIHKVGVMEMCMNSLVHLNHKQFSIFGTDIIINKSFEDQKYGEDVFLEHAKEYSGRWVSFIKKIDSSVVHSTDVKGDLLFNNAGFEYKKSLIMLADKFWKIANLDLIEDRLEDSKEVESSRFEDLFGGKFGKKVTSIKKKLEKKLRNINKSKETTETTEATEAAENGEEDDNNE